MIAPAAIPAYLPGIGGRLFFGRARANEKMQGRVGMGPIGKGVKRLLDIIISLVAILVLSPVLLLVTLIIKISDPGPALFRQARLGLNGTPFRIMKFRSMKVNAPVLRNPDGSAYTGTDDPRVTKIGKFIRKTSIDELPQFFNVLLGDMSLVGPRPDLVDQRALYTDEEQAKLLVKPGITGLAQISGRNTITWEERKKLDVQYVREQSVGLDLLILAKTIPYVFASSGINQAK